MGQTMAFEGSSDQVVTAVGAALLRRGYHVVRSFDLQNAVTHHAEGCGCPYHGTSQCACQYVVLLAYPLDRIPVSPRVFTIHAYEHVASVTLQPDRSIGAGETRALMSALAEVAQGSEPEQPLTGYWTEFPVPRTSQGPLSHEGQAIEPELAVARIKTDKEAI